MGGLTRNRLGAAIGGAGHSRRNGLNLVEESVQIGNDLAATGGFQDSVWRMAWNARASVSGLVPSNAAMSWRCMGS